MSVRVKICGLRSRAEVAAAVAAGADYAGLVFFEASPRYVSLADARWIAGARHDGVSLVGLVVDAHDTQIAAILEAVPLDYLQLHGSESPERVEEVRQTFGLPVIKALAVGSPADVSALQKYSQVADMILVDARPPEDTERPGGNGVSFDWRLLHGRRWRRPWILAGGLAPENVEEAIRTTGAQQVDVSSGVELVPGYKDPARIGQFVRAAKGVAEAA